MYIKKYLVSADHTINVGRYQDNQIIINSPYVSPVHAQISLTNGIWTLTDNNSKNGIYVNRKRGTSFDNIAFWRCFIYSWGKNCIWI